MKSFAIHRVLFAALLAMGAAGMACAESFHLTLRSADGPRQEEWSATETAFIVCDTWDAHHSINAVRRLDEFAPRMNAVLTEARARGALIIHAPSDCMPAYAGHPARQRAIDAPRAANLPEGIERWNPRIDSEVGATYPLDQSATVEDDDPVEHAAWVEELKAQGRNPGTPWLKQNKLIDIDAERDYISDRGDEVWNVLEQRGIKQVVLLGVHANMCVLGRPFGLRNMVQHGKRAVLLRDLTDCMYNPVEWPRVDHFSGNDLLMDYIEKRVCPTITSDQIMGGAPFRFAGDTRDAHGLPELPVRDPAIEWAPLSWTGTAPVTATWYRCVLHLPGALAGAGDAKLQVDGDCDAWLDGAPLQRDDDGALVLTAAQLGGNPLKWLVLRAKGGALAAPQLVTPQGSVPLSGGWQIRNDASGADLSKPLMPAQFGASPDIVIEPR